MPPQAYADEDEGFENDHEVHESREETHPPLHGPYEYAGSEDGMWSCHSKSHFLKSFRRRLVQLVSLDVKIKPMSEHGGTPSAWVRETFSNQKSKHFLLQMLRPTMMRTNRLEMGEANGFEDV